MLALKEPDSTSCLLFATENELRLFGCSENFERLVLARIGTAMRKLAYLASLRNSEGQLRHWGLERAYGELTAHEALKEKRDSIVVMINTMAYEELWGEAKAVLEAGHDEIDLIIAELRVKAGTNLSRPEELQANSIAEMIWELSQAPHSSRRVA